jgi:hypothetical protein
VLINIQTYQNGLKCSNGSLQVKQRYKALQAVEPNADKRSVWLLPQRGQSSAGAVCIAARPCGM